MPNAFEAAAKASASLYPLRFTSRKGDADPKDPIESSKGLIDCVLSIFERMLPGDFQCRERFCPVMNRHRSIGMLDQCVVALPMLVRLLMHLHFDLNIFVDCLNHGMLLYHIASADA